MGQRQDQTEIVYGNDCLLGWDPGETPKYIYLRFSKIEKCPDVPPTTYSQPPNDRVFKLTQDPEHPCAWIYDSADWYIEWYVLDAPLRVWISLRQYDPFALHFIKWIGSPPEEGTVEHNDNQVCVPNIGGAGGICVATWRLQSIGILNSLNIKSMSDIFMEMRPLVDGNLVYKYCRLHDATNIVIEFEPD